jgi:hypothetical protein
MACIRYYFITMARALVTSNATEQTYLATAATRLKPRAAGKQLTTSACVRALVCTRRPAVQLSACVRQSLRRISAREFGCTSSAVRSPFQL